MKLEVIGSPDCATFPCGDACCSAGVDVWPAERERLLSLGLATPDQFTGPETDDEGDVLFRTALGPRGCVFLVEPRGCRLHTTGAKPSVCTEVPRDGDEVEEMAAEAMMPCAASWRFAPA